MNTKLTPVEQEALGTVDYKTLMRLKETGFTITHAGAQTAYSLTDHWKLAYEPAYSGRPDNCLYAGYIFRETAGHNERLDIPVEAEAEKIAHWLNQREALLALCKDWRAVLDMIKELDPEPGFANDQILTYS